MTQTDASAEYRYRAFISYRHHQQPAFVRRLELALKQYAKPLFKPPMRIFRDENHLSPGVDLPQLIRSALDESEFLILLASPGAAASVWVQEELRHWCETLLRTDRLLIVLVDGTIATDESQQHIEWDRTTALPAMLRPFLARVPFYIDLRWAKDDTAFDASHAEFKKAVNLLVARLRRVDPNELSGIEVRQHRRNVRLRNSAVAVLVVLLVLSTGTAWFAIDQWHSAEARRQEAVIVAAGAELDQGAVLSAAQRTADDSVLPQAFRRNIALATYDLGVLYENPPEPDEKGDDKDSKEDQNKFDAFKTLDVDELYLAEGGNKLITQGWYNGVHILDLASGRLTRCPGIDTRFTEVSILPGARPYFLLSNEEGLQVRRLEDCQELMRITGETPSGTSVANDALFTAAYGGRRVITRVGGRRTHTLFMAPSTANVAGIVQTPGSEFTAVLLSNGVLSLIDGEGGLAAPDVRLRSNRSVEADQAWRKFVRLLPRDARVRVFNPRIGRGDARSDLLGFHESPDGRVRIAYAKPANIEDARIERSVFDGCMRLEWLASGSLYRLPIEPGCSDATELEEIPFDGGFSSAAFCGPGYPYVTGSRDGDIRWWRPIGIREIEAHALEHVERSWNDSVQTLRCNDDGVLYAGFRATGIRNNRSRFQVVTERSTTSKRDPDDRLGTSSVDWPLQTPVRGSRTLRLIGAKGRLELVGQTAPVWSRQVANTIPYRTGSPVDAAVAVAIDEPRARVWVMTSYGKLYVIDLFTGSPIATVGTIYYSAGPAIDIGFSGLIVNPATGDVHFRHQFHYQWLVKLSSVGEPR